MGQMIFTVGPMSAHHRPTHCTCTSTFSHVPGCRSQLACLDARPLWIKKDIGIYSEPEARCGTAILARSSSGHSRPRNLHRTLATKMEAAKCAFTGSVVEAMQAL